MTSFVLVTFPGCPPHNRAPEVIGPGWEEDLVCEAHYRGLPEWICASQRVANSRNGSSQEWTIPSDPAISRRQVARADHLYQPLELLLCTLPCFLQRSTTCRVLLPVGMVRVHADLCANGSLREMVHHPTQASGEGWCWNVADTNRDDEWTRASWNCIRTRRSKAVQSLGFEWFSMQQQFPPVALKYLE